MLFFLLREIGLELWGDFSFFLIFMHRQRHALEDWTASNDFFILFFPRLLGFALHQRCYLKSDWFSLDLRRPFPSSRLRHAHDGVGHTVGFLLEKISGRADF